MFLLPIFPHSLANVKSKLSHKNAPKSRIEGLRVSLNLLPPFGTDILLCSVFSNNLRLDDCTNTWALFQETDPLKKKRKNISKQYTIVDTITLMQQQ